MGVFELLNTCSPPQIHVLIARPRQNDNRLLKLDQPFGNIAGSYSHNGFSLNAHHDNVLMLIALKKK